VKREELKIKLKDKPFLREFRNMMQIMLSQLLPKLPPVEMPRLLVKSMLLLNPSLPSLLELEVLTSLTQEVSES